MSHTLYQPLETLWSALHLAWDTTRAGMTPTPADMGGKTGHVLTQGTGFVHGDPRRHGETTLPPPHPSNLDGRMLRQLALNQTQAYMGTHGLYGSVVSTL